MVELKVEIPNLEALKSALRQYPQTAAPRLQRAINLSIEHLQEAAYKRTPVGKVHGGRLRQSYQQIFGNLFGILRPTAKYAIYVHQGTGPHDIYPSKKKALYWKGADHPVKVVHHPGTKANPFLSNAANDAKDKVTQNFVNALNDIMKTVASKA